MAFTTRSEARSATVCALSETLWRTCSNCDKKPLSASKRSISSVFASGGAACAAVAKTMRIEQSHLDMGAKGTTLAGENGLREGGHMTYIRLLPREALSFL